MSCEILLAAHSITKIYAGTLRPWPAFIHALFPRTQNRADQHPVLRGVDLTIRRGETVGIMGRNGAGKTTLLGILGGVIQPTSGEISRPGKIAALLGTTAGFNQNFSGRENAYLFCSIQGLSRSEARERLPLIEDFADLKDYFDMPIRTYSSGMQSRLAFACAINVDADVIIIDETLAVGDANFKMKCYDRINGMKESGQTFLLVSHNQNLVANFCTRGVVLEAGEKIFDGETFDAVEEYKRIRTLGMGDSDAKGRVNGLVRSSAEFDVELSDFALDIDELREEAFFKFRLKSKREIDIATLNFGIRNQTGIVICAIDGADNGFYINSMSAGENLDVSMRFSLNILPGRYYISALAHELVGDVKRPLALYQNIMAFDVRGKSTMSGIANLAMMVEVSGRMNAEILKSD